MPSFQLLNKVTLGEMSKFGPSLSSYNGSLALAWIGTDGEFNLLLSADGITWGNKRTFPLASGAQTFGPPALGLGGSGLASPAQVLAVRDAGDQSLLLSQVQLHVEGGSGSTGQFTVHAPSLSANYIAWTGTGDPWLNVATCQSGQSDGTYVPPVYITGTSVSSESSDAGPCLCDFNGQTFIGWRGSGNNTLNVASVTGGKITAKKVIPQYSDFGPALATVGSNLYMAWTGSGNPQLNIMSSPNGYEEFGGLAVLPESSDSGPALVSHNNTLFLAWRGSGNDNLNVARVTGQGL